MERLERREKTYCMLAHVKKNSEKDMLRHIQAKFLVCCWCISHIKGSSQFHVCSCFAYFVLFYQTHGREDYRHRGITVLKLLQTGSDLQPAMESWKLPATETKAQWCQEVVNYITAATFSISENVEMHQYCCLFSVFCPQIFFKLNATVDEIQPLRSNSLN